MNLSTYVGARSRFFSSLESNGELAIVGPDINENIVLKLKDIKSFLSYCSAVLVREPLLREEIELMTPSIKIANEDLSFSAFLNTTKLNDKLSFYFQATTFVNKVSLIFSDRGLLGERNTYKPFDSQDNRAIDSMTTNSLDDIRTFSNKYFKFKNYRGTAVFDRVTLHKKGYTIYLTDKFLYLTIIATKYNDRTGINTYTAILYAHTSDVTFGAE